MSGENSRSSAEPRSARVDRLRGLPDAGSPAKTPEGRAEIIRRSRALSQRERAVLLMIDGRRTVAQLRRVAAQVGAPDSCLDDLLEMGLVALPVAEVVAKVAALAEVADAAPQAAVPIAVSIAASIAAEIALPVEVVAPPRAEARTASMWPNSPKRVPTIALTEFAPTTHMAPLAPEITIQDTLPPTREADADAASARRLTSELFDEFVRASAEDQPDSGPTTLSASQRGSRIDSMMSTLFPLLESAFGALGRVAAVEPSQDEALEEARRILVREVRAKAPVTGALTLVKLRRAATREDLVALLDEVGSHISIPMRRLSTQQTLLHVRGLLNRPM
ncbi:MAG TPA: hypothetical protein VGM74_02045 [Burkholderiaceae bacterium]|jgi:hypothetical protein